MSILLRSNGVSICIIINVVKLVIIIQLFSSVRILLQPSSHECKNKEKFKIIYL